MANHGYVKTRNRMSAEKVYELLVELNSTKFKNLLTIEFDRERKSWALSYDHYWRHCWLEDNHNFEMRHGPGGNWWWWVDFTIINEVARKYNGTISDDGCGERWKAKPHKEFQEFSIEMASYGSSELSRRFILQQDMELTPIEFRFDTGARIVMEKTNKGFILREVNEESPPAT